MNSEQGTNLVQATEGPQEDSDQIAIDNESRWLLPIEDKNSFLKFFKLQEINAERLVTSPWFDAKYLLLFRIIATLFLWIGFITSAVINTDPAKFFFYLTHLSFIGLLVFMTIATISTAYYIQHPIRFVHWANSGWFFRFFVLLFLYSTNATLTLFVPIVFWSLLSDGFLSENSVSQYTDIVLHLFDFIVFYSDVLLARMMLQKKSFVLAFLTGIIYFFWMWLAHALIKESNGSGWWVYGIFSLEKANAPFYYIGVFVLFLFIFMTSYAIHYFKDKIKIRPNAGSRLPQDENIELRQALRP